MLRIMSKSLNSDITKLITKYLSIREHSKLELKNKLIEKGFAYENQKHVYFEVKKFADYGKLSNKNLDD